jgi:hypothetical protein
MKKFSIVMIAAAMALAVPTALNAQACSPTQPDCWNFTFSDGTVTASGTILGEYVSPGEYIALSGSITLSGGTLIPSGTGELEPNPNGPTGTSSRRTDGGTDLIYDDLFFPDSNQLVDGDGLVFSSNGWTGPEGTNGPNNTYVDISAEGSGVYNIIEGNLYNSSDAPGYDGPNVGNSVGNGPGLFVPEGGSGGLYLLLAGAVCCTAFFFSFRNRLGSRASSGR